MAAVKVTFSLDDRSVAELARTAERLRMSKSEVVRNALGDYAARAGRMSEAERRRALRTFDAVVGATPARPVAEVDRELAEVARARRSGGRRTAGPG